MGELLRTMERQRLGRPSKEKGCDPTTFSAPPTLSDLGYTKDQSHRWQTIAELPDEDFERELAQKKEPAISLERTAERKREGPL